MAKKWGQKYKNQKFYGRLFLGQPILKLAGE
jgi:hypothetical protein